MPDSNQLLISGFSTRAAAWSAVRAGLNPILFDQCRDLDFPSQALVSADTNAFWNQIPEDIPFLPTGGWENQLEQLQFIAAKRPLLGNSAEIIQRIRNPVILQLVLETGSHTSLAVRSSSNSTGRPGYDSNGSRRWIRKPLANTGGFGIHLISDDDETLPLDGYYDQEFITGPVYSAQFFSPIKPELHQAEFLGITKQLTGCMELPDNPFAYTGTIASVRSINEPDQKVWSSHNMTTELREIGSRLAGVFHLQGVWGFDFKIKEQRPAVIEVNPRYTAALEILELVHQTAFLKLFQASDTAEKFPCLTPDYISTPAIGKAFLFATASLQLPDDWDWRPVIEQLGGSTMEYTAWETPQLSDMPRGGMTFSRGDPICTVWATGDSIQNCEEKLLERKRTVQSCIKNSKWAS